MNNALCPRSKFQIATVGMLIAMSVVIICMAISLQKVSAQVRTGLVLPVLDISKKPSVPDWALYASKSWLLQLEQRLLLNISIPVGAADFVDRAGNSYQILQSWHDDNVTALRAVQAIMDSMPETGSLQDILNIYSP